jgi:hypothetical protein
MEPDSTRNLFRQEPVTLRTCPDELEVLGRSRKWPEGVGESPHQQQTDLWPPCPQCPGDEWNLIPPGVFFAKSPSTADTLATLHVSLLFLKLHVRGLRAGQVIGFNGREVTTRQRWRREWNLIPPRIFFARPDVHITL